jgi:hypothetical protein
MENSESASPLSLEAYREFLHNEARNMSRLVQGASVVYSVVRYLNKKDITLTKLITQRSDKLSHMTQHTTTRNTEKS